MRVALFVTCLVDTLFPEVGQDTVALLERLGVEVDFPQRQTCCGQMHVNTGYRREALPMVENFLRAFSSAEEVVAPSASCVALVREAYPELARETGKDGWVEEVEQLASRVWELSEFLVDRLGVVDVGASFPYRVAYHPTCHSLRSLHLGDRPKRLLSAVRGLTLVDLPHATTCCGFGGTFAVKNADVSATMLADKMADVRVSGAQVLCAADVSCLMHIGGGLARAGSFVEVRHLAQILASREEVG
jgi:L-lactate dehydrogenase complex protein LldE